MYTVHTQKNRCTFYSHENFQFNSKGLFGCKFSFLLNSNRKPQNFNFIIMGTTKITSTQIFCRIISEGNWDRFLMSFFHLNAGKNFILEKISIFSIYQQTITSHVDVSADRNLLTNHLTR